MSTQNERSTAVCVYCASSPGIRPEYKEVAAALGKALALSSRCLIYGGGKRGLMGAVSNAVLENGGCVTGIEPRALVEAGGEGRGPNEMQAEAANNPDSKMKSIVVESMHERKTMMARLAGGGFVALPGGFGTFEEVLEAITWSQIGIHQKPVVLLNVNGFWEPLRLLISNSIAEGFIASQYSELVVYVNPPSDPAEQVEFDWGKAAIAALEGWQPPKEAPLFDWGREGADKLESA